ncbi:MAG: hypothetical protein QOH71_310 [Blastocatellia bacterium]|jgi:hypothetical protein|nr:hypothetical protein [Blastocatellia bacterium]
MKDRRWQPAKYDKLKLSHPKYQRLPPGNEVSTTRVSRWV